MPPPLLSVVSPVYGSAEIVRPLVQAIVIAAGKGAPDFEILLVDDSSPDGSWGQIKLLADEDARVKGILLSRNFGQHAAITAGIANAHGQFIVVMDCDLQDDPEYIPALLAKAAEGYEIVLTRNEIRHHAWYRNLAARLFNRTLNLLAGGVLAKDHVGSYSLLSRKAADAFLKINDVHRHYLLILHWLGFKMTVIPVEHKQRHSGRSTYTISRLLHHALAGITSHSTRLLKMSIALGATYFCGASIGVLYLIVTYFQHGYLAGWASSIVLLLGSTGLILMSIGVLGVYIGNIFEQVRNRPLYLIQDHVNLTEGPR
jgi:polyisoprenyl-phosphate glycosyltransferase